MRPDGKKQTFPQALKNALSGVGYGLKHERNVQIDVIFAAIAVCLGFFFKISEAEWLAVLICIGAVLALETINTSLESLVDLASPDFHTLAGRTKDTAAGACLVMCLASLIVGCIIFFPRIWCLFF